ncbi:MAG: hypothetical protein GY861_18620 [bacterium]|nr:hypothetical protein [bacterium]
MKTHKFTIEFTPGSEWQEELWVKCIAMNLHALELSINPKHKKNNFSWANESTDDEAIGKALFELSNIFHKIEQNELER